MKLLKSLLPAALLFAVSASAFAEVRFQKEYAKVVYDVAVDGGSSTSHASNVTLPSGANGLVITGVWVYTQTNFTHSGTGSIALQCAGTQDLMAYQDPVLMNPDYVVGAQIVTNPSTATAMIAAGASNRQVAVNAGVGSVPTDCIITTVVRGNAGDNPMTAGKFTAIIEYFRK